MPTRADFEAAASLFAAAAEQVGALASTIGAASASDVLFGGTLGAQVPARIQACSSMAASCVGEITDAEETCRERAALIAAYEAELEIYDRRFARFRREYAIWQRDYDTWYYSGGTAPYPAYQPSPPPKPAAPPAWADVRRV